MRVVPVSACLRGFLVPLLAAALLGACARLPAEEARGTPAEAVAAQGFARLSATGMPLGSAVAIAPDRLLTNAHVIPAGVQDLSFRRGDGAASGPARLLARSDRMDLAVLEVPAVFAPAPPAEAPPAETSPLWAAGSPAAGPAVVAGHVTRTGTVLPGHGPGFTARIGALLGYSGGPALDGQGRLLGLVTAVPQPGAAPLLAALSGMDLDGLARGDREVFLLGIEEALTEAARIAPR
ncbi:serine protease [Roseomonas sp. AR75]|uniref:S1 family peptidase n=1 Tax=Roseomonas sp. AR75 TaxID=2562311 RepID=UPI0010BF9A41|nr:serine protease [Roseomonas sp. AR75]